MKKVKSVVVEHLIISAGSLILAIAINVFLAPNKTSGGGVAAIATVLLHLFGIKMAFTNLVCNAVLFLVGYKFLGKYALVKTVTGILTLSLFLELTTGFPAYTDDITASTIIGGVLMGIGIGLAVRCGASTGGSDFAALTINKLMPHISVARIILIIDILIIAVSGVVFGSFTVTVYSAVALYICSAVMDAVVTMGNTAKGVQIISSAYMDIADGIMKEYRRGVTGITSVGMYTGKDGKMLYCVVSPKQLPGVVKLVKNIDEKAFIIITDVREVLGEGFRL